MNNSVQIFSGVIFFLSFFGMIIEKASLCPNEWFEGRFFFLKKGRFLSFFQLLGVELSYFGDEPPTDCKKAFFLSRGTLSRRLFLFWTKINSLVFPLKKWAQLFKKFITMIFWQKISARFSQLESTLPEGLFAEFFFAEKNHLQKRFRNLSGSSLCFVEKFRQIREKCITASRWICWGIVRFLWRNNGLQLFFGRWDEKCRTLAKNQQHCQVCVFICLKNLFQDENFSWNKQTFCKLF